MKTQATFPYPVSLKHSQLTVFTKTVLLIPVQDYSRSAVPRCKVVIWILINTILYNKLFSSYKQGLGISGAGSTVKKAGATEGPMQPALI